MIELHVVIRILRFILISSAALLLLFTGFLAGFSSNVGDRTIDTQVASWKKPAAFNPGYAYLDNDQNLNIIDLQSKNIKLTGIKPLWGGAASGLGESEPLSSPDGLYTVYIDKETGRPWLMSNGTLEKVQMGERGGVGDITGWMAKR